MHSNTDIEMRNTVVYAYAGVIVTVMVAFLVIESIDFSKVEHGAGKFVGLMISNGNLHRISTVVLCIIAVVFLALAGRRSDGVVPLLSGILGGGSAVLLKMAPHHPAPRTATPNLSLNPH